MLHAYICHRKGVYGVRCCRVYFLGRFGRNRTLQACHCGMGSYHHGINIKVGFKFTQRRPDCYEMMGHWQSQKFSFTILRLKRITRDLALKVPAIYLTCDACHPGMSDRPKDIGTSLLHQERKGPSIFSSFPSAFTAYASFHRLQSSGTPLVGSQP